MLLQDTTAIVYGGAGAIGSTTATVFAREGATVHLVGRTPARLDAVAAAIRAAGGRAETAQVDALDADAVDAHAAAVVERDGRIDVSFNALGIDCGEQGVPLADMTPEEYGRPIRDYTHTHFVTARAAARHMVARGSGAILALSSPPGRTATALTGAFAPAHAAVETMARQMAVELGPHGVRVTCLRPGGMPDSVELGSHVRRIWSDAAQRLGTTLEEMLPAVGGGTVLGRPTSVHDLAEVAAFVASGRGVGLTGAVVNASLGAVPD